jgi:hypothetical protein
MKIGGRAYKMWGGMELGHVQWLFVVGAGIVIGALALVIGQRTLTRRVSEEREPSEESDKLESGSPSNWAEKRRACRRKGRCIDVELTDQKVQVAPWHAWVADRSLKGLRLNVDRIIALETILNVRVCNLNPPMPWMEIKVVHCKPSDQGYEIGCEFITTPTWNLLLMFG